MKVIGKIPTYEEICEEHDINGHGGWSSHPDYCYKEGAKEMYEAFLKYLTPVKAYGTNGAGEVFEFTDKGVIINNSKLDE